MSQWLIAIAVWLVIAIAVGYDARGRRWRGWTTAETWTVLALVLGILVLPFYLLARARTTRRSDPPPAGWYRDPQAAATQRYWDGHGWTSHKRPKP